MNLLSAQANNSTELKERYPSMELCTNRFILRSIDPDMDDLTSYLSWLTDKDSNPFIEGVSTNWSLAKVRDYVRFKNISEDTIFLGIFTLYENLHIGNIKLEPIIKDHYTYLGILIGEVAWRGRKVGAEVISKILDLAFESFHMNEVRLGVDIRNVAAYRLYLKLGFTQCEESRTTHSKEMSIDAKSWNLQRGRVIEEIDKYTKNLPSES
jgi:RimJ/RimL family protein N-acetyltransferase